MNKKGWIGLILAIIVFVGMYFVPEDIGLSTAGIRTLGILISVLILLITETFPIGVTCLFSSALLVLSGAVESLPQALSGYTNPIVFFVLISFGISRAITKVPLSSRLLRLLMKAFGKNTKTLLFAIMLTSALVSSIVSNVATTAVFIPIIMSFIKIIKDEQERKKTAKCYMIALPVASMIGGCMTPAGSSLNLLCISLLESTTSYTISFVQWMSFGIPIVAIMLPVAWFFCLKIMKPADIPKKDIQEYIKTIDVPAKMEKKEKYVLLVIIVMFIFWVLSSWFPAFNITIVGCVGFFFLFLPFFPILTWDDFSKSVSWPAFFLVAALVSLGNALVANGVSDWIVNVIFASDFQLGIIPMLIFTNAVTFLLLIPIPVAPALITMITASLAGIAAGMNLNPAMVVLSMAMCISNCYLLPLDTVPLLTYLTGSYKMFDMPKVTAWIQISMVFVVTFVVYFISRFIILGPM